MKTISMPCIDTATQPHPNRKIYELAIWTVLLAAINLPLLAGKLPYSFIFDFQMVASGQLWRIVTYPFAHVSLYHLLLDATAFLMIYGGLEEKSASRRLLYTAGCGIGCLLFSIFFSPTVRTVGLAGLSGVAHGLTAVTSMEILKNHKKGAALFRTGIVMLAVVTLKSVVEVWTGNVFFSTLHLGDIGAPVVEAHLGGVMGGIGTFILLNPRGHVKKPAIDS